MEYWVQSQVTSYAICGKQSDTEWSFSPSFFSFPILINIPPSLHTINNLTTTVSNKSHTSRELITYKCTSETFHSRFENDQQSFRHVLHRSSISPVSHHCIWIVITCSAKKLGFQDVAASTVLSEFGFIQKYWSLGALVVEGNYEMIIVIIRTWNQTITQSLHSSMYRRI